jgi:hypothetical protein
MLEEVKPGHDYPIQQELKLEVPIQAIFKLFESSKISSGDFRQVPGGATLEMIESGQIEKRHIEHREILHGTRGLRLRSYDGRARPVLVMAL